MKVKLVKGLSYYHLASGVSAQKGEVVPVDDAVGAELVATGRFVEAAVSETSEAAQAATGTITTGSIKPLSGMKTAELEAYASEKGIDISECKTNSERVEAIKAAEEAAQAETGAAPGFEE